MGSETQVVLSGFGEGTGYAKFRAKAQAFLRAHQDHIAIHKLRLNNALTAADLTEHGVMEAARLYESPFTDLTPHSPDGLFRTAQVDALLAVIAAVRATAVAA